MKRKAIFFDIDGTLCDEENRIPESVYRAVAAMKEAGHAVLLCSGRSRGYIYDDALMQMDFDGIVSSAGAMVELNGRTLYCRLAPQEALVRAVETARRFHYGPILEGNRCLYMERDDFSPSAYIDKLYRELKDRLKPLDKTYGAWEEVPKLSMIAREETCPQQIIDLLKDDWDFIVHTPAILELVPPGTDKGTGLTRALDALGLTRGDSVAFGDSMNDLAMFNAAGLKIAMGNSSPALMDLADHVTTALHDDGIWNAWQWLQEQP